MFERVRRMPGKTAPRARRGALVVYMTVWLAAGAAVAVLAIVALGGGEPKTVAVPPVEETQLDHAAVAAGCELRRASPREHLNPAVTGPAAARPAHAGFYDAAPDPASLVSALREGVIVIQFRDLDGDRLHELHDLQQALPEGTIVAPNGTGMPYQVAVTAYRRLLGCGRISDEAIEAVQLFRGRYLGSGPDA